MINKITFIIAFFILSTLNAQTTFDWDTPTPIDNGDNVTQTTDGITTTFTISGFNSVGFEDGAALDGTSDNVVTSSESTAPEFPELATPSTEITFSFSAAVDITSIIISTGASNSFTFTPTGGSNSTVVKSAFSGGVVDLNWTDVTSFVVTGSNAQYLVGFDNLIVSESTLSSNNFTQENISIFPNPVNDFLYFGNVKNIKSARVYNSLGQLITETKEEKIDFRTFKSGLYVLQIKTDTEIINKRIIKK